MALTLVEAAKQEENVFARGVIATFIDNMRITQLIPFRGITDRDDRELMDWLKDNWLPEYGARPFNICGLHIDYNLTVITRGANRAKNQNASMDRATVADDVAYLDSDY